MSLGWFPCLDVNNRENAKLQSPCILPEIFTAIVEYECSEKKMYTELPLPYHISISRLDFTDMEKYIFCLHWRFQFLMLEVNSGLGIVKYLRRNWASPLFYNQIVLHWRSYNMTRVMMVCKICRTRLRPLTQKRIWLSIISSRADHSVFGGRRSISFRIHILGTYSSGKLPSRVGSR